MMKRNRAEEQLGAFLALWKGELPDRPIWTADLSYWLLARQMDGSADPSWSSEEGFLRFHHELGVLPYYYYPTFFACEAVYDRSVEWRTERKGDVTRIRCTTPVGTIVQESQWLPVSFSEGVTRHFVQSEQDLDVLCYLIEHRRLEHRHVDSYPERRVRFARFGGLPALGMPRSPLPAFLTEWSGIMHGMYLLMDHPDRLESLFALMEAQTEPVVQALCDLAPPLVHVPDNLSGETMAGLYARWLAPVHMRLLARLHAAGIAAAVHQDGTLSGLLPQLAAAGFDAVEALTPTPAGDVPVERIRDICGSQSLVLWGGVPGALFAPPFHWEQMEAHVQALLHAWHGSPYVVGVADQVPPDGRIDWCRSISRMIRAVSGGA